MYVGALLFLCLRTPFQLVHGFVYDEEGTVYLRYAWDAGPWRALVAPHQGYYSLFANVCGVIAARVIPLELSAHFLFFAEIAVQMLLVYMLVECECFRTFEQKAMAVALVLLSPPTESVVLSTIHGQFFLAVTTAVLLVSDAERLRWQRLFTLLLAGLTGMTSCALMPLFSLQAWKERSRARALQAGVLALCAMVQAKVLYFQPWMLLGPHSTLGFYSGAIVSNGLLGHFFTYRSFQEACSSLDSLGMGAWRSLWWLGMEACAVLFLAAALLLSVKAGSTAKLLYWGAILNLALGFKRNGAVNEDLMCGSGGRYFFAFNALVGLTLLLLANRKLPRWSAVARVLIAGAIVSGVLDRHRDGWAKWHPPVWAEEVARWRADPQRRVEIRPGYWPGVRLTAHPRHDALPPAIYDTTEPEWRQK